MKIENTLKNRIAAITFSKDTIKEYASKNGFYFFEDEQDGECYAVISYEDYYYSTKEDIQAIESISIEKIEVPGFLTYKLEHKV